MDKMSLLKMMEENSSILLKNVSSGKAVIKIEKVSDCVYVITQGGRKADFLLREAVVWLDFYESKRGPIALVQTQTVQVQVPVEEVQMEAVQLTLF
jgi:hypothetical protein